MNTENEPEGPPIRLGQGGRVIGEVTRTDISPDGITFQGRIDDPHVLELLNQPLSVSLADWEDEPSPVDRARRLAEHSQNFAPDSEGAELRFGWDAYQAAGGTSLTAWRAFQAGLWAQVSWLEQEADPE